MKAFDFSVPTRVFFGNGELRRLQETAPTAGTMAPYATMVTNNENSFILLKIGGLSRFNFN
jgi:alcohol dehydrogenase YqhD (iron-dependent ADH family)